MDTPIFLNSPPADGAAVRRSVIDGVHAEDGVKKTAIPAMRRRNDRTEAASRSAGTKRNPMRSRPSGQAQPLAIDSMACHGYR